MVAGEAGAEPDGAARDLVGADQEVFALGKLGGNAEGVESGEDQGELAVEVVELAADYEGEVEVSQVVVDGAAAGGSAGEEGAVACQEVETALLPGVLVASDDDGGAVSPEVWMAWPGRMRRARCSSRARLRQGWVLAERIMAAPEGVLRRAEGSRSSRVGLRRPAGETALV